MEQDAPLTLADLCSNAGRTDADGVRWNWFIYARQMREHLLEMAMDDLMTA